MSIHAQLTTDGGMELRFTPRAKVYRPRDAWEGCRRGEHDPMTLDGRTFCALCGEVLQ